MMKRGYFVDVPDLLKLMFWAAIQLPSHKIILYISQHNQVLHCLVLKLSDSLAGLTSIHVDTDLPDVKSSESKSSQFPHCLLSLLTIPTSLFTMKHVSVTLLELTSLIHHLESARDQNRNPRKKSSKSYQNI